MLLEKLNEHKLMTEVWWQPLAASTNPQRTRSVQNNIERSTRKVIYFLESSSDNTYQDKQDIRSYVGYIGQVSLSWEPLALYIREIYGNGIYYSHRDNGQVWLLVISDNVIVPGTDCTLSRELFDLLMEERKFTQYKNLPVTELAEDCVEQVLTLYRESQKKLKRQRILLYVTFTGLGLVLLAAVVAFILI